MWVVGWSLAGRPRRTGSLHDNVPATLGRLVAGERRRRAGGRGFGHQPAEVRTSGGSGSSDRRCTHIGKVAPAFPASHPTRRGCLGWADRSNPSLHAFDRQAVSGQGTIWRAGGDCDRRSQACAACFQRRAQIQRRHDAADNRERSAPGSPRAWTARPMGLCGAVGGPLSPDGHGTRPRPASRRHRSGPHRDYGRQHGWRARAEHLTTATALHCPAATSSETRSPERSAAPSPSTPTA